MPDAWDCKCKRCKKFHNNVSGDGYCKECSRINRLFLGRKCEKLKGVMLPQ